MSNAIPDAWMRHLEAVITREPGMDPVEQALEWARRHADKISRGNLEEIAIWAPRLAQTMAREGPTKDAEDLVERVRQFRREVRDGLGRVWDSTLAAHNAAAYLFRELTGRELGTGRDGPNMQYLDEYLAAQHGMGPNQIGHMTMAEIATCFGRIIRLERRPPAKCRRLHRRPAPARAKYGRLRRRERVQS